MVSQKALADCGAALSLCLNHGRLLSALSPPWRKTFSDYIFNRNKEEKKETKNNSPGYLSLSCASLGTWELPALSRIVVSSRRYRNLIPRGANSLRSVANTSATEQMERLTNVESQLSATQSQISELAAAERTLLRTGTPFSVSLEQIRRERRLWKQQLSTY